MDELVSLKDVIWQLRALQNECPGFGFFGSLAIERLKTIKKEEQPEPALAGGRKE